MSDIMKSIPFGQLTEWILNEYKKTGQVFGIQKAYVADQSKTIEIFGRKLENPVGPAAGPIGVSRFLSNIFSFLSISAA